MKATPTVAEFDPVRRDGGPDNSIRTRGLTKAFGSQVAVKDIDLDLPNGGVVGFVGPNGAGKSTTIRILLGLIDPTAGEAEALGHSIARPSEYHHLL